MLHQSSQLTRKHVKDVSPFDHHCCACRAQKQADKQAKAIVLHQAQRAILPTATGGNKEYTPSAAVAKRLPSKWPRPAWHPPWRNYRVVSGHLG